MYFLSTAVLELFCLCNGKDRGTRFLENRPLILCISYAISEDICSGNLDKILQDFMNDILKHEGK